MGAEPSSQNALPEDEHPVENQLETLLDIRPTDPDELYPKSVQEQEVKSPIKHCPRSLEHSIGPPMFSEPSRSKLVEQFVPLLETQPPSLGWNEGSPTSAKPSYLELVHLNESPDAVPSPLPDRRPEEVEFKKGDDRPEGTQFGSLQAVPQ
ncbi:uncharacterized protein EI90DRAFT_2083465 [Cantharellus anzutake]|uniref:uncharacterized protein n=1 Tax=Cantharellus anzutake TaxID=1750568 RepID=UPI0019075992|nr:uncharacterized protein EI90DRAFT_2083465 [Cantharellus anzutake]KAF8340578.1 hypothetical protein EI90DRAFT_2083465 [Cantharellus anzutake]